MIEAGEFGVPAVLRDPALGASIAAGHDLKRSGRDHQWRDRWRASDDSVRAVLQQVPEGDSQYHHCKVEGNDIVDFFDRSHDVS